MAGATMVRDLVAGSLVEGTFAVTRKRKRARKDGRPYLDVELADRSGRVAGRVWEAVPLLEGRFDVGDTVRVLGRGSEYGGRVEMELRDVERVEGGDPLELVPGARRDTEELDAYVDFLCGEIHDPDLSRLARTVLEEPGYRERFRTARATETGHHAYAGGLIEHTVAVAAMSREAAQLHPRLNSDLLLAAALLHDCGCVDAFAPGAVILPSEEGAALGHVYASLRRVERHAGGLRTPRQQLLPLLGCIASHHGPPEGRRFPSPEAAALHAANQLDARIGDALRDAAASSS